MLFVVYEKVNSTDHTIMVGAFLMKSDALDFISSQKVPDSYFLQEVSEVWSHWRKIGDNLNEQILREEGE